MGNQVMLSKIQTNLTKSEILQLGHRLKLIHFKRRNTVRWTLSKLNKMYYLDECSKGKCPKLPLKGRWFSPTHFEQALNHKAEREISRQKVIDELRSAYPVLVEEFADLLEDPVATTLRIYSFLGVTVKMYGEKIESTRVTASDLRDSINNFVQVRNHFNNTKYFDLFIQDENLEFME